jgi:hypothetical protein
MGEQTVIDHWSSVKDIIDKICIHYDNLWKKRQRALNSKMIVMLILKIVLGDRRQGLSTNLTEFWDTCLEKGISLPQEKPVSASSFCEARQKLSEDIFKDLNKNLLINWKQKRDLPTWQGHRVYAVDGSRVNLPRELLDEGFKLYDKERRHYPQGLLSCLYDVLSKTVYDFDFVAHMNERTCVTEHLKVLEANDLVILDRGYFSYFLLHEFHQKEIHAIFRLQQGTSNKQIEEFLASSKKDVSIDYIPSPTVISDLKKQGHMLKRKPLRLRLIKHKLNGETYFYGTTLLDKKKYPAFCFAYLYHERWDIEELYKISKQIVDIENFHAKTRRGIKQEIYAHLLLINLSRFFEFDAQKLLPPSSEKDKEKCEEVDFYKFFNTASMFNINFKNCLTIVGRYLTNLVLGINERLKNWVPRVLNMISRVRQKIRPGRQYPRRSYKPTNKWQKTISRHKMTKKIC